MRNVMLLENPKTPRPIQTLPNQTALSRAMFSIPYACGGGLSGPLTLSSILCLGLLGLFSWRRLQVI